MTASFKLSPVGRWVQGHPMEKQTKDMQGNALTVKTGPNAGQPTQRFFMAVAYAKNDPAWPEYWAWLHGAARAGFPTLFDKDGNCLSRDFSFKCSDGDDATVSKPGETPNTKKEGFPGHWVIKYSSSFEPQVFFAGHTQPTERVTDPRALQRGDYVRVWASCEGNANSQRPGIYVNLSMVEIAGKGVAIVSGPDANAVFGGAPVAALPAGAMALPGNVMPGAMPSAMPGFAPPAGAPMMAQPAPAAVPASMPAMQPMQAVQPHPGILAGPGVSAPPQMAVPGVPMAVAPGAMAPMGMPQAPMQPMAPAAPVRQMTPAAGAYTYEQYIAVGHTDASLRAAGLMV